VKKGFTILELLVAAIVVCIAIALGVSVLRSQNSNMLGIRQRVMAQTSARDGLKVLESELRVAGFGTQLTVTGVDKITNYTSCNAMLDANGSAVSATDGSGANNDILYVAYPTAVDPTLGVVNCNATDLGWSKYSVDASGNLIRTTATSFAGLATSTATTTLAPNVDVFQVRLGVMGSGTSNAASLFLSAAAEAVPAAAAWTTTSFATTAGNMTITPGASKAKWYVLSPNNKTTDKGERLRMTFNIHPNAAYFTDLTAPNTGTLSAGIFDASGNVVAVKQILTIPAAAQGLDGINGNLTFSFDLVDPVGGSNRRIGFAGKSGATPGMITVNSMNAIRVGRGALTWPSTWYTDPGSMLATDWVRTKSVEVILLSKAKSDDGTKSPAYPGLANYNGTGTFTPPANDANQRVKFDHVYPVGNNGGY
jgi:prepilin-type N-terminal cleavage/methylation domain-containing protein